MIIYIKLLYHCYITHDLTLTLTSPFCLSLCVYRWSPTCHSLCLTLSLSVFSSYLSVSLSLFLSVSLSVCLSFCLCSWTAACLYVCQQHNQKHYGSERATSILLTLQEPQGQGGAVHWWDSSVCSVTHLFAHLLILMFQSLSEYIRKPYFNILHKHFS